MRRDPIVEEIHRIRKKLWEECGRDLDRYFDMIEADEALDKDRLVSKIPGRKKRRGNGKRGQRGGMKLATTGRIEIDPKVMLGRPVIRGTRVTVELILRKLSEGATEAELLDVYPRLISDDIRAALAYAADTVSHEETVVLKSLG